MHEYLASDVLHHAFELQRVLDTQRGEILYIAQAVGSILASKFAASSYSCASLRIEITLTNVSEPKLRTSGFSMHTAFSHALWCSNMLHGYKMLCCKSRELSIAAMLMISAKNAILTTFTG